MSEERRKRQQERMGTAQPIEIPRKVFIWAGVTVLVVGAYLAYWYHDTHRYDAFAKCLSEKQAKMYGLYWCPHCLEEKEKFGKSFQYVNYVECAIKGSKEMAPACSAVGAAHFPSWQFNGGPLKEGVLSLEDLGSRTGC